jgi:hypothetical protein
MRNLGNQVTMEEVAKFKLLSRRDTDPAQFRLQSLVEFYSTASITTRGEGSRLLHLIKTCQLTGIRRQFKRLIDSQFDESHYFALFKRATKPSI